MKVFEQKASGRTEEVSEGFNGWAVLFGPLWYLYKGMIGMAILFFIGVLILTIMFDWFGAVFGWIIMGATANRTHENYLISKGYTIVKPQRKKTSKKIMKFKEKIMVDIAELSIVGKSAKEISKKLNIKEAEVRKYLTKIKEIEYGLEYICTNCGSKVKEGDVKCKKCKSVLAVEGAVKKVKKK